VLGPRWFSVATWLGAFLLSGQTLAFGQRSFLTADQVIAKYQEAIGGSDRFSSVMTFVEKGDVTGNLTDFVPAFHSPPLRKQQGIFEFYFKSPNRRLGVLRIEDKVVGMLAVMGKWRGISITMRGGESSNRNQGTSTLVKTDMSHYHSNGRNRTPGFN